MIGACLNWNEYSLHWPTQVILNLTHISNQPKSIKKHPFWGYRMCVIVLLFFSIFWLHVSCFSWQDHRRRSWKWLSSLDVLDIARHPSHQSSSRRFPCQAWFEEDFFEVRGQWQWQASDFSAFESEDQSSVRRNRGKICNRRCQNIGTTW